MFDFLFGGKRKLNLIRKLIVKRWIEEGFGNIESRLRVEELGQFHLLQTPEGIIVAIAKAVIKRQGQGALLSSILLSLEKRLSVRGSDPLAFSEVLELASGPIDTTGQSVGAYCYYRLNIEFPGQFSLEEVMGALDQCVEEILAW